MGSDPQVQTTLANGEPRATRQLGHQLVSFPFTNSHFNNSYPMDMGRLSKSGIEIGSPTPLEAIIMSETMRMIQCDHIECGGQEQPHSFDNGIGEWDCDGPCSPRRVQAWKDKQTKVTTQCEVVFAPVCIKTPHVAYKGYAFDCEAHGNEMPCPCGCGTTYCEHISESDPRVCVESGLVDCGTEHCSIHTHLA